MEVPAGMLDGLPCAVQEHPDLRFRLHHLVVGHSEQSAVEEQLVAVADEPFPGAREAARAGELTDGPVTLSVAIDDWLAHDLPFAEQAPEIRIGPDAARHAVAVARDGDCVCESRCVHRSNVLSVCRRSAGIAPIPCQPALFRISRDRVRLDSPKRCDGRHDPCTPRRAFREQNPYSECSRPLPIPLALLHH